jgi:undecaprenyl-diphosphatase
MESINTKLFLYINSFAGRSVASDALIIFLAQYLWYLMILSVVGFIIVAFHPKFRHRMHCHIGLGISVIVSTTIARGLLTEVIRFFYANPRPFEVLESARQLVNHAGGHSFPSGHASISFATAGAIALCYPRASIIFFTAAALISVGRIAAGVHWPADIVAGALIGVIGAGIATIVHRFVLRSLGRRGGCEHYKIWYFSCSRCNCHKGGCSWKVSWKHDG